MSTNRCGWVNKYSLPTGRILVILPQKGAEDEGTRRARSSQAELEKRSKGPGGGGRAGRAAQFFPSTESTMGVCLSHSSRPCMGDSCHKVFQPETPPEGEEGPLSSCPAAGTVHVS